MKISAPAFLSPPGLSWNGPATTRFDITTVSRGIPTSPATNLFMSEVENSELPSIGSANSEPSKKVPKSSFDSFDYSVHWYPVCWARDVPLNQPIRVTLFDVDYVLAKTTQPAGGGSDAEEEVFYAMIDSCPHKKVSLSEGRITDCGTPDKKYFQCSYHGWAFDGKDGKCVEIPQTAIAKSAHPIKDKNKSLGRQREDATAVAVMQQQGMVWIQPFLTPLEALVATEEGTIFSPPRIPEMDLPGYRTSLAVRDFPIDWTVLMENIMDPDHGFFAHSSSSAAYGFDLYAADGKENMMDIEEEFLNLPKATEPGKGWTVTSTVNAVEKLKKYNREVRLRNTKTSEGNSAKNDDPPKKATTTFVAPYLIHMARREDSTTSPSFVSGFWVCPVGTGRSRFMATTIAKVPFTIPRWMTHLNLNNFLDQDTFLLCGQHRAVLQKEAEGYLEMESSNNKENYVNNVRKSTYVYRSPSERLGMRIGQFFDATLSRVPNRRDALLAWYDQNTNNKGRRKNEVGKAKLLLQPWPSREFVLDRYEQHTKICPDSQGAVRKSESVMKLSKVFGLSLIFLKMILHPVTIAASTNPAPLGLSALKAAFSSVALRLAQFLTNGQRFYLLLITSYFFHRVAEKFRKEFYFKRDEELHRSDVKMISKKWSDL